MIMPAMQLGDGRFFEEMGDVRDVLVARVLLFDSDTIPIRNCGFVRGDGKWRC